MKFLAFWMVFKIILQVLQRLLFQASSSFQSQKDKLFLLLIIIS